ncbi:hypothetical protein CYMTET_12543 [Cymbomonas tetramitiformis]|uniref:Serine aminopeptidase S33 domain-containing protein n=1 Tax=Cymbomonas tetramitiformis TaxID=36881 RepID=A0AAE0GK94_9CHLO|nr:hypothetical protein CYMTET_12543 [Cymbomonas tetramitiformis]
MFIFHGLHEHSGRYAEFAKACNSKGIICSALDFFGHGRSIGYKESPGDIGRSWRELVSSGYSLVVSEMSNYEDQDVQIIIFGHSMGALLAFHIVHALRERPDAPHPDMVILCGIAMDAGPSAAAPFGCKCLNCIPLYCGPLARGIGWAIEKVDPQGSNSPIDGSQCTHDSQNLELRKQDFYHYLGDIRNRTGHQLLRASHEARKLFKKWGKVSATCQKAFRLLLLHGEEDTLCYSSGSCKLFATCPVPPVQKFLKLYPNLYHELLNELPEDRAAVLKDIFTFIDDHPKRSGAASEKVSEVVTAHPI